MGDAIATGLKQTTANIKGAIVGVLSRVGVSVGSDTATKSEQRRFGDLETIQGPAHTAPRPELQDLSNDDLKDSIMNPKPGQEVKVREGENTVLDGNGRINEARRRGIFSNDDMVPVYELPKKENLAPWEHDSDETDSDQKQSDDKNNSSKGSGGNDSDNQSPKRP